MDHQSDNETETETAEVDIEADRLVPVGLIAPELAAGIVEMQAAVQAVAKLGHNTDRDYNYAKADDIAAAALEACKASGMSIVRLGWTADDYEQPKDAGTDRVRQWAGARVSSHYALIHRSGHYLGRLTCSIDSIESRGRQSDKAEAAALTYCNGFALLGFLGISRTDPEIDVDRRPPDGAAAKQRRGRSSRPAREEPPRATERTVSKAAASAESPADPKATQARRAMNASAKRYAALVEEVMGLKPDWASVLSDLYVPAGLEPPAGGKVPDREVSWVASWLKSRIQSLEATKAAKVEAESSGAPIEDGPPDDVETVTVGGDDAGGSE